VKTPLGSCNRKSNRKCSKWYTPNPVSPSDPSVNIIEFLSRGGQRNNMKFYDIMWLANCSVNASNTFGTKNNTSNGNLSTNAMACKLNEFSIWYFLMILSDNMELSVYTLKKKIGYIYQSCIEINKPSMLIFNQQMVGWFQCTIFKYYKLSKSFHSNLFFECSEWIGFVWKRTCQKPFV
jgi:hypothetical protein